MSKIKGKFIEDLAIETNHLADGSVTEEKLHSDLATKIENKADASALDNYYDKSETDGLLGNKADKTDLPVLAKDANQKFFGGGDVSVVLNSGPMSDGYTISDGNSGLQGNADGTETRERSQPYIANFSGTVENIDLFCSISPFAFPNISEGYVYLELYNADNDGLPTGSPLASSSHIDYTLFPVGSPVAIQFTFGTPVEITKDNVYAIVPVLALTASAPAYSNFQIVSDSNNGYSEFLTGFTSDNGSSWSLGSDVAWNFQFHIVLDNPISSLSFTENINVARPGLALEDNVIEAPVSPISLNDGELLYVIPNEDDQGSALTLTAATSETLPDNALVLAYRDGEDIVVDGIRLEPGQSAKLGQAPAPEMIDAYTKSETDALLLDKANVSDLADYIKATVDDATLEIDTEVLQVKDGGIDTDQLADGAVTEAKLHTDVVNSIAEKADAADLDGKIGVAQIDDVTLELAPESVSLFDSPPTAGASDKDLESDGYSKYALRFVLESATKIQTMKFHAIRPTGVETGWVYGRIWSNNPVTNSPQDIILSGVDGINTASLTENQETELTVNFSQFEDPLPPGIYYFGIEYIDNDENFRLQLRNGDIPGDGGGIYRYAGDSWNSSSSPIVSFIAFELNGESSILQVKDGGIDTAQLADEAVTEAKLSLDVQSKLAAVGTGDAADITYDNQTSGLTADDVQDAIDEVVGMVKGLPDPIIYKGTYDADNNIPALSNADEGVTGHLYQVTVDGTQDFGAGPIEFHAGDKVVNNGSEWQKWDMTDAVTSVNGQTGAVVLDTDDISEGSTNLYFTDTRAKTAAVVNSLAGSETDQAPSVSAVNDALSNLPSPPSNVKETFVLNSTDISNEYIDLSDLATANSVQIMIRGAGAIMEGASYDYTVSEVGGVTRITFTAALMNELAENDVVQVTYMK